MESIYGLMGLVGLGGGIVSFLLGLLVFFIIRGLWFGRVNHEIVDVYNKQIDLENKISKIEFYLRMLVRMEKCRMIEEGYIDGEKNKFINWNIDKDLKPHKVFETEKQTEENVSADINITVSEKQTEENIFADINIEKNNDENIKKENKNIFKIIINKFKK